jgi:hypothetical protein
VICAERMSRSAAAPSKGPPRAGLRSFRSSASTGAGVASSHDSGDTGGAAFAPRTAARLKVRRGPHRAADCPLAGARAYRCPVTAGSGVTGVQEVLAGAIVPNFGRVDTCDTATRTYSSNAIVSSKPSARSRSRLGCSLLKGAPCDASAAIQSVSQAISSFP